MTAPASEQSSFTQQTMLVGLKISSWTASKKDLDATHEVANNHLAEASMGSYNKKLLPKGALDGIKRVERELKSEWKKLTVVWEDEGYRLASNEAYFKIAEIYRDAEIQHAVEVQKFIDIYSAKKEEAKQKLGTLYKEEEYPMPNDLKSKFSLELPLRKTPETADLRGRLHKDDLKRNEESMKRAQQEAVKDVYRRFQKQLIHIGEKLKEQGQKDVDQKRAKTFHDTLMSNMTDLIELLPILNVTKDPALDELAEKIKNDVCKFNPDILRTDEAARNDIIEQADKILADMGNIFA